MKSFTALLKLKFVPLFLKAGGLFILANLSAATVQFDVNHLFNADVIVNYHNTILDTDQKPIDTGFDTVGGNYTFLTQSAVQHLFFPYSNVRGLPDDGYFGVTNEHPEVRLAFKHDNHGDNVFRTAESTSLSFPVPPGNYTHLHLFLTSGDNPDDDRVTLTTTLYYTDETQIKGDSFIVPDWFHQPKEVNSYYLINGLNRVKASGNVDGHSEGNKFAIFGYEISVDNTKVLDSVFLDVTIKGNSILNFFGATGEAAQLLPTVDNVKITGIPLLNRQLHLHRCGWRPRRYFYVSMVSCY